jgi:mRNA interferase MazF
VKRGEVWWVEAPDEGRRPHLILTRDTVIPVLSALVGVPATRTVRGIPTEVALGPEDGMPEICALTLDNVRTLRKGYFVERICALGPNRMASVCRALAVATACDD